MNALHLLNPNSFHALCARFARRPRVTEDTTKVTCQRCLALADRLAEARVAWTTAVAAQAARTRRLGLEG